MLGRDGRQRGLRRRRALQLDDDGLERGRAEVGAHVLLRSRPQRLAGLGVHRLALAVRAGERDLAVGQQHRHVVGVLVHRGLLAGTDDHVQHADLGVVDEDVVVLRVALHRVLGIADGDAEDHRECCEGETLHVCWLQSDERALPAAGGVVSGVQSLRLMSFDGQARTAPSRNPQSVVTRP